MITSYNPKINMTMVYELKKDLAELFVKKAKVATTLLGFSLLILSCFGVIAYLSDAYHKSCNTLEIPKK